MKYVVNALIFLVIGVALASAEVYFHTWQYWAIVIGAVACGVNSALW